MVSPTHQSDNLRYILYHSWDGLCARYYCTNVGLSDHYLAKCKVTCLSPDQLVIRRLSRNWKRLDLDLFNGESGCHLSVRSSPLLPLMAALCSSREASRRHSTNSHRSARAPSAARNQSRWLSGGSQAKQTRRRLEQRLGRQQVWMQLGRHTRAACRVANRLITESESTCRPCRRYLMILSSVACVKDCCIRTSQDVSHAWKCLRLSRHSLIKY